MSLESLCDQDSITVYAVTAATGAAFGVAESYAASGTVKRCLVQEISAAERLDFEARSPETTHMLFFTADPSIKLSDRLIWDDATLRVTAPPYKEGPPGEWRLWIVEAVEHKGEREGD